MTLLSSLISSTNGLLAQSTALSGISDDLANASTTAYKSTGTSFSDLVSSSLSSGTSTASTGSGVTASAKYNNSAQGTISSTSTSTDLAVNGSGYFAVKTATENTDGTLTFSSDTYYTRSGDFTPNADGYMENSEGYYLLGYSENSTTGTVDTSTLTPVQISSSMTDAAVATTTLGYAANLPASADVGTTTTASSETIYDSTGASHDVSYSWTKTDTNTWTLNVTAADGAYDSSTGTSGDYSASASVTFDSSGNVASIDTGDGYTVSGNSISFDLSYQGASTQTISSDLSNTTQYAASSISVSSFTQDGIASGSYSSVSVDSSGNVSVNYSNGESKTYYEIPVATFRAADSLAAISRNAYQATYSSGAATYSAAGTSGAGSISSSSLESSDVDIATEFTDMISTQQNYSANAKVVTSVNEMMKTLVNL
ncbi:MAG: flagellar hook-basal body complex protein [Alphaproteobacteria bacterium]|nr:flagellar hook-basal body complex protein [Alphaproteobacteria bacterium]